jgi:ketosteroid isomerase-like protein
MSPTEIAAAFTDHCRHGRLEAAQAYWSDDVVSVEAFPSPHQIARGREAVLAKQAFWSEGTAMHAMGVDGPFVNGDQFAIQFSLDATGPDGKRSKMREVALYTVADGKIVEERFLPLMA